MLLREATDQDAEALARLMTEFAGLETGAEQMRRRLERSRGVEHPIVAEVEGRVVGFASLRLGYYLGEDAPYAEVSELFVTAPHRLQGIGRSMMLAMQERAKVAGASSMVVLTDVENGAALSVYRATGFRAFAVALQKWLGQDRPFREHEG